MPGLFQKAMSAKFSSAIFTRENSSKISFVLQMLGTVQSKYHAMNSTGHGRGSNQIENFLDPFRIFTAQFTLTSVRAFEAAERTKGVTTGGGECFEKHIKTIFWVLRREHDA